MGSRSLIEWTEQTWNPTTGCTKISPGCQNCNIWCGVTVENREQGIPRINELKKIQSSIRFLSMEPLLEDLGKLDLSHIHWMIVGGESGLKARPMKPEWVENIKSQCEKRDIAFFFKQWGGWGPDGIKRAKKKNGRLLLGRTWDNMPEKEIFRENCRDSSGATGGIYRASIGVKSALDFYLGLVVRTIHVTTP